MSWDGVLDWTTSNQSSRVPGTGTRNTPKDMATSTQVDRTVEERVGSLLSEECLTLAVAESCTGGLIGHRITCVSGSSGYFAGGVIAYSNEVKVRELDVDQGILASEGAVSEPVARQMAEGVRKRFATDAGVGITGIMGPGGDTPGKPVGLVFVAVSTAKDCVVRRFCNSGDREELKWQSSQCALNLLLDVVRH